MPSRRAKDQRLEAFSLPEALLAEARRKAAELGMTRSGFYRYAIALALGKGAREARALSQHMAVVKANQSELRERSAGKEPPKT